MHCLTCKKNTLTTTTKKRRKKNNKKRKHMWQLKHDNTNKITEKK